MTSVSASKVGAVASVGRGGGNAGGSSTHQALGAIAAEVAARISAELKLIVDPDGRRGKPLPQQDAYGVDEIASGLAAELNATPPEAGEIARLLHLFAAEVAARIGAVPDARSVEEIAALLARRVVETRTAQGAIRLIQQATADVAA